MDQDQPSLEESPAPAEAAGESQLNDQGDEALRGAIARSWRR